MIDVGDRAPDFSQRNQHGETVTLNDLAGAPALLVFYPFAFSGICSSELAELRDHRAAFDDAGIRIVAISCDPMFALRVFDDRDALGFTLLSDFWPHGDMARAYECFDPEIGAAGRTSILVDPEGLVRWRITHGTGEQRAISLHLQAISALA